MSKKSSKLANILRSGGIIKIRRDDVSTMFEECQQTILPVSPVAALICSMGT